MFTHKRDALIVAVAAIAALLPLSCDKRAQETQQNYEPRPAQDVNNKDEAMAYTVRKTTQRVPLGGKWEAAPWNEAEVLEIKHYMGTKPVHQPRTQAKLLYDEDNIYVMFRVADRYVRAVTRGNQGSVYRDSCVEFFFTPGGDIGRGYFNVEMNCGGTMLFNHQIKRGQQVRVIAEDDCAQMEIHHSLPKLVDPEITEPVTWTVAYRIPVAMLKKYARVVRPQPGTVWRANFYKCADATSHPHWLTWAVIDNPRPDFHRPEFFGILQFE